MLSGIMLNVIMLNVIMLNFIMLNVSMLNVIMLNVIMLNVIMLNAIVLNVIVVGVVAPSLSIGRILSHENKCRVKLFHTKQGKLTEREGFVLLASSLRKVVFQKR
jgi:hypothetical protein